LKHFVSIWNIGIETSCVIDMCTEGEVSSPTIQSPPIEVTSKATPNLKQERISNKKRERLSFAWRQPLLPPSNQLKGIHLTHLNPTQTMHHWMSGFSAYVVLWERWHPSAHR
jgi:hypothetical protein